MKVRSACIGWLLLAARAAHAAPPTPTFSPTPGGAFSLLNHVVVNSSVYALAPDSSGVYVGGGFSYAGPRTGSVVFWDMSGNTLQSGWPEVECGRGSGVSAAAPDGSGGWYLGGHFQGVAGQARAGLAHVFANGSLDPAFAPSTDGPVYALLLSGGELIVAGNFRHLAGQACVSVGKVDAVTGAFDAGFDAGIPNSVNTVTCLNLTAGSLYLGGSFTSVSGQARKNLAKVDLASGALDPAFICDTNQAVWSLTATAGALYAGGFFTQASGTAATGVAKLDLNSGAADPAFNANLGSGQVRSLDLSGPYLYIGGTFSSVGAQALTNLARVDLANGALDASFNAGAAGTVMALRTAGSSLYLSTQDFNGVFVARGHLQRIDTGSGLYDPSFDLWSSSAPSCFYPLGNQLLISGTFNSVGGSRHSGLIHVRASDGQLDPLFNCDIGNSFNPTVTSLALSGTALYVGGNYSSVNGTPRANLAKVSAISGAVDPAFQADTDDPNPTYYLPVAALALAQGGLYASGTFNTIGGQARGEVAKLDLATGAVDPIFNPNVGGSFVYTLLPQGSSIFLGGAFNTVGASTQPYLAKVSAISGAIDPAFNPVLDNSVASMVANGSQLWIGGSFLNVNGQAHARAALLDASTGSVSSSFSAALNGDVVAIAQYGSLTIIGGLYSTVDGQNRNSLGVVDSASGAVNSLFDPAIVGGVPNASIVVQALAFSPAGDQLYTGGAFQDQGHFDDLDGYAAYFVPPLPSPSPTSSASPSPGPSFTATPSPTPSASPNASFSPSSTPSPTASSTPTSTFSATPSASPTPAGPNVARPAPNTPYAFPNPARGSSVGFAYWMPKAGIAHIQVYNERGDLAAQLSEAKPTGVQVSSLPATGLADGVYFFLVRLNFSGGDSVTLPIQKFVRLR